MSTTDGQVLNDLLLATLLSRKYRSSDQLPTIENLILNGADVNCLDHQGNPLVSRVLSSSIKECGSGFFSRDNNTNSRRFLACLQSHGADIFVKLQGGQSILHHLFSKPRYFLFITHQLLNYCDIYFGDEIISLCRFLDAQGLSLDVIDDQGNSAFSLLIQNLGEEVTTIIKKNYNKPLLHYHPAIKSLLKIVRNIPTHIGETPLLDYVGEFDTLLKQILNIEITTRAAQNDQPTTNKEIQPQCTSCCPAQKTIANNNSPPSTTMSQHHQDAVSLAFNNISEDEYKAAWHSSANRSLYKMIAERRTSSNNYAQIKKILLKLEHSQALFFITARAMIYSCSTSPNIRFLREFFMDDYGLDAIEAKHTPTTKYLALLVQLGADFTQRRPGGDTLLHLLFRKCADIDVVLNRRKNFCQTHYKWTGRGEKCIINFNMETLDISLYLLDKGLSLHDQNNRGETPLSLLLETMQSSIATFQTKDSRWKNRHVVHLYTSHLRKILQASTELPLNINGIPLLEYTHSIDPVLGKCLLKEIMRRKSPQLLPSEQINIVGIDVEPRCDEFVTIKL